MGSRADRQMERDLKDGERAACILKSQEVPWGTKRRQHLGAGQSTWMMIRQTHSISLCVPPPHLVCCTHTRVTFLTPCCITLHRPPRTQPLWREKCWLSLLCCTATLHAYAMFQTTIAQPHQLHSACTTAHKHTAKAFLYGLVNTDPCTNAC